MHRSSKRIVAPLFLLLVAAALFVPEVRGDELVNFNLGFGESFVLPQDATPDRGSASGDDFTFLMIPITGLGHTFDLHFFKIFNSANTFETTNLIMDCDPFIFGGPDANKVCDYFIWLQMSGNVAMWRTGSDGNPVFIPGTYDGGGIVISETTVTATPEPSTLALLLMSFATLFLLAVGFRPSHRS
jgi:hypothetical protein